MSPHRLIVHGASGRMGQSLLRAAAERADLVVVGAVSRRDLGELGLAGAGAAGVRIGPTWLHLDADVIVDFSSPDATAALVPLAAARGQAIVVGTTGLTQAARDALDAASKAVPVLVAANTSVGVAVLAHLVRRATELLGEAFDAEIVEMHHRHKVDAPSGTALRLADEVLAARGLDRSAVRAGREGRAGPRTASEVGVFAMRGGDVIGDHLVVFAGDGGRIELAHKATDRMLFARGALRAAAWLVGRAPGLYTMNDVLGLDRA